MVMVDERSFWLASTVFSLSVHAVIIFLFLTLSPPYLFVCRVGCVYIFVVVFSSVN